jgi:hypothetical protein
LQVLLFLTVLLYTILFEKFGFFLFLIIFDTFICQSSKINLLSRNLLIIPLFCEVRLSLNLSIFCDLFHVPMRKGLVRGLRFFRRLD